MPSLRKLKIWEIELVLEDLRLLVKADIKANTSFEAMFWNTLYELDEFDIETIPPELDCYEDPEAYPQLKAAIVPESHLSRLRDLEKYDRLRRSNIISYKK